MEFVTTRELATIVWLFIFSIWALGHKAIRKCIVDLLTSVLHPRLSVPITIMFLYAALVIYCLSLAGIWSQHSLKDTLVWVTVGGPGMMLRVATDKNAARTIKVLLIESMRMLIFIEFLVSNYTFCLLIELLLLPFLTFMILMDVVAQSKPEFEIVERLTKRTIAISGILLIVFSFYFAILDYRNLISVTTIQSVLLVPMLTISMFPFLFFFLIHIHYERIYVMLNMGPKKSQQLKRYAKRKIFLYAGFNLKTLTSLSDTYSNDIRKIRSELEVNDLLNRAKSAKGSRLNGI